MTVTLPNARLQVVPPPSHLPNAPLPFVRIAQTIPRFRNAQLSRIQPHCASCCPPLLWGVMGFTAFSEAARDVRVSGLSTRGNGQKGIEGYTVQYVLFSYFYQMLTSRQRRDPNPYSPVPQVCPVPSSRPRLMASCSPSLPSGCLHAFISTKLPVVPTVAIAVDEYS